MRTAALVAAMALGALAADSTFALADLAFIAGQWQTERGKARIEERWTQPAGGMMLGTGQTVSGERTVEFEFLRIEKRDDGIFYVAQPNGRPPTDFKLVRLEKQRAVFENLGHDFPQRIIYEKKPDGSLAARVEGYVQTTPKSVNFLYKPIKQ